MMAPLTSRKKMQLRKKPKAAKMGPQMPSGGSATDAVYLPLRAARSRIVSGVAYHAGSRFYLMMEKRYAAGRLVRRRRAAARVAAHMTRSVVMKADMPSAKAHRTQSSVEL